MNSTNTAVFASFVVLFSGFLVLSTSHTALARQLFGFREYPLLFVFTVFFLILLVRAAHYVTLVLAVVGFSLGLYAMIFLHRRAVTLEAGIKYYYLSAVSLGLMLCGMLILLVDHGYINFSEICINYATSDLAPTASVMLGKAAVDKMEQ